MASIGETKEDPLELLIVGAGPHSLTLVLRLIEPCPDMLSDGDRILEGLHTRHGVWAATREHVQALRRGPSAQLKIDKKRSVINEINIGKKCPYSRQELTNPIPLDFIKQKCMVVDEKGCWMKEWDDNFDALEIKFLRSSVYVHPDPYEQRSLSTFADLYKLESEQRAMNHVSRGDDENDANDGCAPVTNSIAF